MKIMKFSRISSKITFFIIVISSIIFIITSFFMYMNEISKMEEKIAYKLFNMTEMYAIAFSEQLWNYDEKGIETLMNSLFKDREIVGMKIIDESLDHTYQKKVDVTNDNQDHIISNSKDIIYNNELIGSIEIMMTTEYQIDEIYERIKLQLLQSLVLSLALVITIILLLKRIIAPLNVLEQDSLRLIEGKKRIRIESYENDEVGRMASTFNIMADSIEKSRNELQALNVSLEQRVKERTNELTEMNHELNIALDDLKITQNELIQMSKLKLTSKLVSGVAHEVNTPLGISITLSSYLSEQCIVIRKTMEMEKIVKPELAEIIDDSLEATQSLVKSLRRVAELIDSFKELAYDEKWNGNVSFLLKEHIDYIISSLGRGHSLEKVNIEVVCPDDLEIIGDPNAYFQIIAHLAINSLEHGVSDIQNGFIKIECKSSYGNLEITISDNGNGIDSKDIQNIFTPFYKKDLSSEGIGLGLSIVENIVNLKLGGTIRCESSLGFGTTFYIRVPI